MGRLRKTMNRSFSLLTGDDQRLMLEKADHLVYQPGDTILTEGESRQALFIVERGFVRVEREHMGYRVPFARLGEGEVFGEMSFLESLGASASVAADGPVEVLLVEGIALNALLASVPGFATRFYQSLAVALSARLRSTSFTVCPPMSG